MTNLLTGMSADLLFALRRLRSSPLYTAFAVVTLAIAIGVTAAVYSLVRTGLKPFIAVEGADRLVVLTDQTFRVPRPASISWLDYEDIGKGVASFDAAVAWLPFMHALAVDGQAEFVNGEYVSGSFFAVIGATAMRGRVLDESDAMPGAAPVAVIAASAWRRYLDGDPGAIGRIVKVSGQPFRVIGIMPDTFRGIDRPRGIERPELWLPLEAVKQLQPRFVRTDRTRRSGRWLSVAGRLRPGATADRANLELTQLAGRIDAVEPLPPMNLSKGATTPQPRRWEARGVNAPIDFSDERAMFRVVLLLPTLVLLVACTNLANFSLSRGIARRHELAVRQAIGASRWQLMRGQIIEYGMVATAGAAAGIFVARQLLDLAAATMRNIGGSAPQFRLEATLDPPVLMATAGAGLLSVVVAGLLPALSLTRRSGARAIASDQATTSPPRWRGRGNLIALQLSVSVALLLVAALCVRELPNVARADPGIRLDDVGVVVVPFDSQALPDAAVQRVLDETLRQAASLPVSTVSYASSRTQIPGAPLVVTGTPFREGPAQPSADVMSISPGYLPTVGLSLVAGRNIADTDFAGSQQVALISATLARNLFGAADPIGRSLTLDNQTGAAWFREPAQVDVTVVGIVSDTRHPRGGIEPFVYRPFAQRPEKLARIEILGRARGDADPALIGHQLRESLRRANPDVAVTFSGRADVQHFTQDVALRLFVIWFGTLAFLALAFAMSGLYGVLSHVVALRTRELGVRAALGADRRRLIRLVLKDGARPVIEGVVIGLGLAAGVRMGMQPWFEDPVTAVDPVAIVIALVPLLAAASVACYLPARRAAKVDPNVALRHL